MTTIATAIVVLCVLTGWAATKASGAKRFLAGAFLLPKYAALAVAYAVRFILLAISLLAAAAMAVPRAVDAWLDSRYANDPGPAPGRGKGR